MQTHFLQTASIWVTAFTLTTNEKETTTPGELTINVQARQAATDDRRTWNLGMDVRVSSVSTENPAPQECLISVAGQFVLIEELPLSWPGDELARLVGINGFSLLFGFAREQVCSATARSPAGIMTLPTVSFSDYVPVLTEAALAARAARAAQQEPVPKEKKSRRKPRRE